MGAKWQGAEFSTIPTGKGRKLKEGESLAVLSIGTAGNFAAEAITMVEETTEATVAHYDLRFAKPLDEQLLREVCLRYDKVITVEDGVLRGGVGEAVTKFLHENNFRGEIRNLGIEDKFIEHGTPAELYAMCGFDAEGIALTIKQMLA